MILDKFSVFIFRKIKYIQLQNKVKIFFQNLHKRKLLLYKIIHIKKITNTHNTFHLLFGNKGVNYYDDMNIEHIYDHEAQAVNK